MNDNFIAGGKFACAAARVFDGENVLEDHAVLVENRAISGVVPRNSLPKGIPLLDEPGCTVLPGLIDSHIHFMRWQGPLFLANGVTTVRDVGNDLKWILERRGEWEKNLWPRILCVGPLLDGAEPFHKIVSRGSVDSKEAVEAVRETAAAGVDGIKLYVGLKPEWLSAMAQEGHDAGLKVSIHCFDKGVLEAGRAGVDEFFHLDGILADIWPTHPPGWLNLWGSPEFSRTKERQHQVADSIRDLGMTATPTLAYWDSQWRIRTAEYLRSEELRHVPSPIIEWQSGAYVDPLASSQWRRALEAAQRFVGMLFEMGVPILAGSDSPCGAAPPGSSLWRELSLLAEAGLSPKQALYTATSNTATFLGRHELGWLRAGASADMVFVRGNPLEKIPGKPEIVKVVRHGTVFKPEELLKAAETAASSLRDEPWGIQFTLHYERR